MNRQPIKHCHKCANYEPGPAGHSDPLCRRTFELHIGFPILQTVRFQRSSGWLQDCGPGAQFFEEVANVNA